MSNNSGCSRFVLAVLCLFALCAAGCGAGGVDEPPHNNVRINGTWNVELMNGPSTAAPTITFGLTISQTGAVVSGNIAPYTGSSPATTPCLVFTGMTAQGNVNQRQVSLVVSDPQSKSSITISGTANDSVTEITGGTFATNFGPVGDTPACANINGTATLSKQ